MACMEPYIGEELDVQWQSFLFFSLTLCMFNLNLEHIFKVVVPPILFCTEVRFVHICVWFQCGMLNQIYGRKFNSNQFWNHSPNNFLWAFVSETEMNLYEIAVDCDEPNNFKSIQNSNRLREGGNGNGQKTINRSFGEWFSDFVQIEKWSVNFTSTWYSCHICIVRMDEDVLVQQRPEYSIWCVFYKRLNGVYMRLMEMLGSIACMFNAFLH